MKSQNTTVKRIILYIIAFVLIIECNSVYSQIYGVHLYIRASLILVACIALMFLLFMQKTKITKRTLVLVACDYVCSILMFIRTSSKSGIFIIILDFMFFLPLILVYLSSAKMTEVKQLLNCFINIVIILCLISLFMWFFSSIIPMIKPTGKIKAVWAIPYSNLDTFFGIHFNTQDVWWITGSSLMRNTGIYTEGPMYGIVLLFALIFNNIICFEKTRNNFKRTCILTLTMISTISVTGILGAFLILVYCFFKNYYRTMKIEKKRIIIVFLLGIIIVTTPFVWKMIDKKLNTGSAIHRNMDISNGIQIFFENPLIGKGINHDRLDERNYLQGYGYSNTIIPVLTDGGIILGTIYLIPAIALFISVFIKKKSIDVVLFLLYILIFLTTLIPYRMITLFFIAMLLTQIFKTADTKGEKNEGK